MTDATGATGATADELRTVMAAAMRKTETGLIDGWAHSLPAADAALNAIDDRGYVIVPRDRALDAADAAMSHDDLVTAIAYLRIFRNRCGPNNGDGPILDGLAERLDARLKRLAGQP